MSRQSMPRERRRGKLGLLLATVLLCTVLYTLPGRAHAFGPRGHQVIGAIADQLLSPNARAHVQSNLGMSLRAASTWADCLRDVVVGADGEVRYVPDPRFSSGCAPFQSTHGVAQMVSFARRNWRNCEVASARHGCHATYHYTDVDIHRRGYDRAFAGTSEHDVVGTLEAAISVLEGSRAPRPHGIDGRTEALLLLSHLVGDVHQPLHVGAISLDSGGRPVSPRLTDHRRDASTDTRGGNRLDVDQTNLHAVWDEIPAGLRPSHLPGSMIRAAREVPLTSGAIATWPVAWADESLGEARRAFGALTFDRIGVDPERRWATHFADRASYMNMKDRMQTRQLIVAGARLAQLLNSIWP